MTMVSFRAVEARDLPVLKMLLYEAIYQEPGTAKLPFSVIEKPEIWNYLDGFGERPYDLGIAAELSGRIIGAAWSRILFSPIRGYGNLDADTPELAIALFPQDRGCGIGTALLNALILKWRISGIRQVSLSVDKRNPAFRLYLRAGFSVVHEKEEDFIMLRQNSSDKDLTVSTGAISVRDFPV